MRTGSKTAIFALEDGVSASYSIRLEEEEYTPETVSPSEAATVIDAIYEVDPCDTSEEETEEEETSETDEETEKETQTRILAAFSTIGYNPCKYVEGSYEYEKDIFVYRSHVDIDYNLVLNNGSIGQTKIEEFEVYEAIEVTGDSIRLEAPILELLYCDAPVKSFDGNTVYFLYELNGHIKIRYKSQHDIVTVRVNGTEESAQSCKCLAFYQELVAELTIDPPEEDEDAKDLIGCTSSNDEEEEEDEPEDPETCYQRYIYSDICRCSGTVKDSSDVVKEVSCSKLWASSTVQGAYNHYWEAVHKDTYVSCPEEEGVWDGADREYYKEQCCEYPPLDVSLPICQSIISNIVGVHSAPDHDEPPFSNRTVSYIPVSPKDGICGTWEHTWEVKSKDCCDSEFYEDLNYNEEDSVEVLADNSSGWVFWSGGFLDPENPENDSQATVTVRGTGFWVDQYHTEKTREGYTGSARIYTDEDSCGSCTVEISDDCSSTSGTLKSTNGYWSGWCGVAVYYYTPNGYSKNRYRPFYYNPNWCGVHAPDLIYEWKESGELCSGMVYVYGQINGSGEWDTRNYGGQSNIGERASWSPALAQVPLPKGDGYDVSADDIAISEASNCPAKASIYGECKWEC